MKKTFKFLATISVLFVGMSFTNASTAIINKTDISLFGKNIRNSIVTQEEYNSATVFEKRMINQIDASIAALDVLNKNSNNQDLEAIVSISKNINDKFSNAIIISKVETNQTLAPLHGSCNVSGISSAYSCLKTIKADKTLKDEFDIHVKRNADGSVTLTW